MIRQSLYLLDAVKFAFLYVWGVCTETTSKPYFWGLWPEIAKSVTETQWRTQVLATGEGGIFSYLQKFIFCMHEKNLKIDFCKWKTIIWNSVYSDRSELDFSVEAFKISVWCIDEYTAENYRNGYVAEKRIVSTLLKISIPNFNSTNWRLQWRLYHHFTSLKERYSRATSSF